MNKYNLIQNDKGEEKILKPKKGITGIFLIVLIIGISMPLIIVGHMLNIEIMYVLGYIALCFFWVPVTGFKIVKPNEAVVLLLFGKYKGTIKEDGFFLINPFYTVYNSDSKVLNRPMSLKAMTLDNQKQKVNDIDGNPIEVGVIVIWQIEDTFKANFNVENYREFVSIQADATIRNIVRQYPYDSCNEDKITLRASSKEISEELASELQDRVEEAGIKINEARISHLAYATEIAAAMLQRQQAQAIVDARTMIVEGAVSMVQMALEKLSKENIVELDDERKAQMVSNLMVVLCGNKDPQPVVNTGSLY